MTGSTLSADGSGRPESDNPVDVDGLAPLTFSSCLRPPVLKDDPVGADNRGSYLPIPHVRLEGYA